MSESTALSADRITWTDATGFAALNLPRSGVDIDFGMRWGASLNGRVTFIPGSGANTGALYAYDPARNGQEWALLARCIPLAAVEAAWAETLNLAGGADLTDYSGFAARVAELAAAPEAVVIPPYLIGESVSILMMTGHGSHVVDAEITALRPNGAGWTVTADLSPERATFALVPAPHDTDH